jgi:hypothetical protein
MCSCASARSITSSLWRAPTPSLPQNSSGGPSVSSDRSVQPSETCCSPSLFVSSDAWIFYAWSWFGGCALHWGGLSAFLFWQNSVQCTSPTLVLAATFSSTSYSSFSASAASLAQVVMLWCCPVFHLQLDPSLVTTGPCCIRCSQMVALLPLHGLPSWVHTSDVCHLHQVCH